PVVTALLAPALDRAGRIGAAARLGDREEGVIPLAQRRHGVALDLVRRAAPDHGRRVAPEDAAPGVVEAHAVLRHLLEEHAHGEGAETAAPEEYGGGGLGTFAMCVLLEEMSQHRMGLYNPGCGVFGRNPPPVIWGGTTDQIERYAVPALREGYHTFFAITEPSGGSDPAGAIQSRGEKRGDHWVLNGTKMFISHAHEAEWGVVFVRTDRAKGREGISCFIIERGTPGFTARPIRTIRTVAIPNE